MFLVLLLVVLSILYYLVKYNYDYWKRKGIPGPKPSFLVGNVGQSFLFKRSLGEIMCDIYDKYPNIPLVGLYKAFSPALMVRDPEIIKDILVKNFNAFNKNDVDVSIKDDPIMGRNPFFVCGDEWKTVRQLLSPCFTSGKMKQLYPLLEDSSKKLIKFINAQPEAFDETGLEAKELCVKFTLNNVGSSVFGLDSKCFEDPKSEFRDIAQKFISPESSTMYKLFLLTIFPWLSKIISLKLVPKEVDDRITEIVEETIKYREKNNIVRNDFLHIMNQVRLSSKNDEFTMIDIVAHAAGFFGDGFETSSSIISFVLYELAANPETQSKLRGELNKAFAENGNASLSYETLQEMQYLDAVFLESHRMHPALMVLTKRSTGTYMYVPKPTDGITKSTVKIEPGLAVVIPIHSIQNDPKFFKDPERFQPERFLGKNKENIASYTYMPFGEGPRACLGQRFGILQIKIGVAYIIKNFEIRVNKKTQTPFKYDPVHFMVAPLGGIWLNFKKIHN